MSKLAYMFAVISIGGVAACSDSSTSSGNPLAKVPAFLYVSDQSGGDQIFTYLNGTTALFPPSVAGDAAPQSANGRVVFTSYRDSPTNSEIYSASIGGGDLQRLTNNPALDFEASLSPDGTKVLFASLRSGTSRLWLMNADGSSPTAVETGANQYTPETTPRFSPNGSQILFNSARTGTSQLWVMPTAGGTAVQVSHETGGAFDGSWSSDGASAFYVSGSDRSVVRKVSIATGNVSDYVSGGTDLSQPACNADMCLVVSGASTSSGNILAYVGANSTSPITVIHSTANERSPAILHP